MVRSISQISVGAVLSAVLAASAQAGTITVGPGGGYDFSSIQAAIGAAGPGDTVLVHPGRYYENIDFLGRAITVKSINPQDANIVAGTVIDANGLGSVVTFNSGEDADSVLKGLTITNGHAFSGGGIDLFGSARPTISYCAITNNVAEEAGGGVYSGNATIANCSISDNAAGKQGGGLCSTGGPVRNCIIRGNYAGRFGGGVCYAWGTFTNCTIVANTSNITSAGWPGAGIAQTADFTGAFINCIIWANQPDQVRHPGQGWHNPDPNWRPITIAYSCVFGMLFGIGNISDDPLFVNPDANDYRLRVDSPCINAGDPGFVPAPYETDIDGEARVLAGRVDMGADEFGGNLPPVADAGPDQSMISIPSQITLRGYGSYDLNGDSLTYRWQQTAGPQVHLDDSNAVSPTFAPAEFGAYVFELVVSDGFIDSVPDTVFIVIGSDRVPVAEAGLPRYAADQLVVDVNGVPTPANDYVVLDGTGSHDPDNSGRLTCHWRQVSGPQLAITGEDTPRPTVTGFSQTDSLQVCEFELVVSDGDYNSPPDTTQVIIVRAPHTNRIRLENDSHTFDPYKPTTIHFGGDPWCEPGWDHSYWQSKANVMSFSDAQPDFDDGTRTYARVGDVIIAYLSGVAPDYVYPIQITCGSRAGLVGPPVALHLNRYDDARYAVNHLTFFDCIWVDWINELIDELYATRVGGEPFWVDNYRSTWRSPFRPRILNVQFDLDDHSLPQAWYRQSTDPALTPFNGGAVAGAYWSVLGPGKNLQLARVENYRFKWFGDADSGYMDFLYEPNYPGRLPEPVVLIGPIDGGTLDPNAPVGPLTCEQSQNAVSYQLLMGPDPYRVADYNLISETPTPPNQVITTFPFEETWWTIKVGDQYGSTLYADPVYIDNFLLSRPVRNLNTGKRYGYIQHAIDDADPGDELLAPPGAYHENISFKGKNLTLTSEAPHDLSVVANTVINGDWQKPVVTFTGYENRTCLLAGFTITGGKKGICCRDSYPTITNCRIEANAGAGIESTFSVPRLYAPRITNCAIVANEGDGVCAQGRISAILTNCVIAKNKK
ncbi:MAG: PKD domain-containing protein, partial [Planctomycetota bacterium]